VHKKRYFIPAALLSLCCSAYGETPEESLEKCKIFEGAAKVVMTARQDGEPMSKLWDLAEGLQTEVLTATYKIIIQDAYAQPRLAAEQQQQEAVMEFQNKYFSACILVAQQQAKK
jgi:hypothetical protein